MTLLETLTNLPAQYDDYHLKIGAVGGSAFFYGGTVQDMKDHIDEYSGALWEVIKKHKELNEAQCRSITAFIGELKNDLIARVLSGAALSENEQRTWKERLDQQQRMFALREQTAHACEQALAEMVPLSHRTVIDQYEATAVTDPTTLILIISGAERGTCWTVDELNGDYGLHSVLSTPSEAVTRRVLAACQACQVDIPAERVAPGAKYGFLRALRPAYADDLEDQGRHCRLDTMRWLCLCEACGNKIVVRERELLRGHRRSCGCRGSRPKKGARKENDLAWHRQ